MIVSNFRDDIPKLTAWHQWQQIVPIFQWKLKLAENFIFTFFLFKHENWHFHFINWHIFCFANLMFRDHFFQLKIKVNHITSFLFFYLFQLFFKTFIFLCQLLVFHLIIKIAH
jgi:hypothetical protein